MTESKEETGAMTENKHRQTFAVLGPILVVFSLIAGAYIGTVNQVDLAYFPPLAASILHAFFGPGLAMVLLPPTCHACGLYRHGGHLCPNIKGIRARTHLLFPIP